jgi:hypothetical protein
MQIVISSLVILICKNAYQTLNGWYLLKKQNG